MPGSGTVFTLVVSAILAVLSCSREATAASVRFTLDLRGINESAQADFQQAVEAGFAGVRHRVVAGELAEYAVRGAIRKEGSVYTFELAVVGVRDETILGERKGRCGPCTQEEALKKVRMAGKFLELAGLDVPAPSVLLPSDGPAVSTAAAAEADPGGGNLSERAPAGQVLRSLPVIAWRLANRAGRRSSPGPDGCRPSGCWGPVPFLSHASSMKPAAGRALPAGRPASPGRRC